MLNLSNHKSHLKARVICDVTNLALFVIQVSDLFYVLQICMLINLFLKSFVSFFFFRY